MKKAFFVLIFICLCLCYIKPQAASADIGPKPSVTLSFEGLKDRIYYVTLLSYTYSTGPHNADLDYIEGDEIWEKFKTYEDEDGYYVLDYLQKCQNNSEFKWVYYPPKDFKILIYFPDSDTFLVSQSAYTTYAFNSYYHVKVQQEVMTISNSNVSKNYNYLREILNLGIRIVLTLLIEIGIALLFRYKSKQYIKIILITNIITQILLNVFVNTLNYFSGILMVFLFIIPLEIMVFIIEAIIYYKYFNKINTNKRMSGLPVLYAFVANLISFFAGLSIMLFMLA